MAKKSTFASMSVASLLKMRDEIGDVLGRRASELKKELSQLASWGSKDSKAPKARKSRKGKKVAPQFRSKKDPGLVWSGRGGTPRWMKAEMKGTNLKKENFRIK
jgi:DNA-binding protein H-NS